MIELFYLDLPRGTTYLEYRRGLTKEPRDVKAADVLLQTGKCVGGALLCCRECKEIGADICPTARTINGAIISDVLGGPDTPGPSEKTVLETFIANANRKQAAADVEARRIARELLRSNVVVIDPTDPRSLPEMAICLGLMKAVDTSVVPNQPISVAAGNA